MKTRLGTSRRWRGGAVVLAVGLLAGGISHADDWAQFRRDPQRTGASKDAVQLPLVEIWYHPAQSTPPGRRSASAALVMSTAAVWRDRIAFVAGGQFPGSNGQDVRTLFAADARTGTVRWRQPLGGTRVNAALAEDVGPAVTPEGVVLTYDAPAPPSSPNAVGVHADTRPPALYSMRAFRLEDGTPGAALPLLEYPGADPRGTASIQRLLLLGGHGDTDRLTADADQWNPGLLAGWFLRHLGTRPERSGNGHFLVTGSDVVVAGSRDLVTWWNPVSAGGQFVRLLHPLTAMQTGGWGVLATPHAAPRLGGYPMALSNAGIVIGEGGTDRFLMLMGAGGGFGRAAWHFDLPWFPGTPGVSGSSIVLGVGGNRATRAVVAIDSATGEARWMYPSAAPGPDPSDVLARVYQRPTPELQALQPRRSRGGRLEDLDQSGAPYSPDVGGRTVKKEPAPWSIEQARARWGIVYRFPTTEFRPPTSRFGVASGGGRRVDWVGVQRAQRRADYQAPPPRMALGPPQVSLPPDATWTWAHGSTPAEHGHPLNPGVVVAGGRVYGVVEGSREAQVVALDEGTGRPVWTHRLKAGAVARSLAASQEHLFVSSTQELFALRLGDGEVAWRAATPFHGTVAVGSRLLFMSTPGSLHALAPAERTFRLALDASRLPPGRLAPDDAPPRLALDPPPPPGDAPAPEAAPAAPAASPSEPPAAGTVPEAAHLRLSWGSPTAKLLERARAARAGAGRAPLLVTVDWLDPARRGVLDAGPTAAWTPARTADFVRTCGQLAAAARPAWFDIGPEVNVYLARQPTQAGAVLSLVRQAAAAVRQASPRTKVLVSFNAEVANGSYGATNHRPFGDFPRGWKPDQALMKALVAEVDALGITSRPQAAANRPNALPGNHLLALRELAGSRPLLVTQAVVQVRAAVPLPRNQDVPFLRRHLQLCYWLDAALVVYPDVELDRQSGELAGLARDPQRPGLGAWEDVPGWKRVTRLSAAPPDAPQAAPAVSPNP